MTPKAPRKRGPRRQPTVAALEPGITGAVLPRTSRKPKKGKPARKSRKAKILRVDAAKLVPAMVGLKEPEAQAMVQVNELLAGLNKRGRARVIDALSKIHAA